MAFLRVRCRHEEGNPVEELATDDATRPAAASPSTWAIGRTGGSRSGKQSKGPGRSMAAALRD
jgi:hypothetical protein